MFKEKWTIIDRKTQIASIIIIIVGIIIVGAVFISLYLEITKDPFNKNVENNYNITTYLDERFFGTWINSSPEYTCEYPSTFIFYEDGLCNTSNESFSWIVQKRYHRNTGNITSLIIDGIHWSNNCTYHDEVYFKFLNDNNTLMIMYDGLKFNTYVYYEKQ